jgi:hypothetical protein
MADGWRRHLETTGEPWYMLAEAQGKEPWLAESGGTRRSGTVMVNLVVGYGSEPGPWVKVGTWDAGYSGADLGRDVRAEDARDNIADRLVLAAAEVPEGAAFRDPAEVERRLQAARAAVAPWEPTELHIDGTAHAGLLSSVGRHQIVYSTAVGRCVFAQSHDWPVPTEIVSCADHDVLDVLLARRPQ